MDVLPACLALFIVDISGLLLCSCIHGAVLTSFCRYNHPIFFKVFGWMPAELLKWVCQNFRQVPFRTWQHLQWYSGRTNVYRRLCEFCLVSLWLICNCILCSHQNKKNYDHLWLDVLCLFTIFQNGSTISFVFTWVRSLVYCSCAYQSGLCLLFFK